MSGFACFSLEGGFGNFTNGGGGVVCNVLVQGMERRLGAGFGWKVGCGMGGQVLVCCEITRFILARSVMTSMSLCE